MSSSEESDTNNTLYNCTLPRKSKMKYLFAYNYFMRWRNERNVVKLDEDVFLTYFTELSKVKKPSTLWSQFSMLKATMLPKHGVDLQKFGKVLSHLKRFTIGFKSEKSKILTEGDVLKFVTEAPDDIYLVVKVALIIGVSGACKIYELTNLTVNDITMHGDLMLVRIPQPKKDRTFIIRDQFVPIVKKYQALRPKKMPTNRFFVNYRAGACTRQVIGRNKLSSFPKQVAGYLKLANPERYTGMCFKSSWISSKTSLMIVEKQKVNTGEDNNETGQLRTFESKTGDEVSPLNNTDDSPFVDIEDTSVEGTGVDIKIEEMDTFDFSANDILIQEEFDNDFQIPISATLSTDVLDVSDDTVEDNVQITNEKGNRIITVSPLHEESQSENDPRDTNIHVAGNNIQIVFKNCAHVGNITVNVFNKKET